MYIFICKFIYFDILKKKFAKSFVKGIMLLSRPKRLMSLTLAYFLEVIFRIEVTFFCVLSICKLPFYMQL